MTTSRRSREHDLGPGPPIEGGSGHRPERRSTRDSCGRAPTAAPSARDAGFRRRPDIAAPEAPTQIDPRSLD